MTPPESLDLIDAAEAMLDHHTSTWADSLRAAIEAERALRQEMLDLLDDVEYAAADISSSNEWDGAICPCCGEKKREKKHTETCAIQRMRTRLMEKAK